VDSSAVLLRHLRQRTARGVWPVIVGIDGRSGSGKSTLASALAAKLTADGDGPVTVIEGDDFYAGASAETWDRRTAADKADRVIDWRRQRTVLEQLRSTGVARWRRFDWDAADWDADVAPFEAEPVVAHATGVVLLEGAYSCRPELHDLLDLRVLLDVPHDVRRRQLLQREGDAHEAEWDARWSAAEDHYFSAVMPPERFDVRLGPAGGHADR
jgi:uridine kinase